MLAYLACLLLAYLACLLLEYLVCLLLAYLACLLLAYLGCLHISLGCISRLLAYLVPPFLTPVLVPAGDIYSRFLIRGRSARQTLSDRKGGREAFLITPLNPLEVVMSVHFKTLGSIFVSLAREE